MKIRQKDWGQIVSVTGQDGTERFVWTERTKKVMQDGKQLLLAVGKCVDVTETFKRFGSGNAQYVRRAENIILKLLRENFKLRGLTPTDSELASYLDKLGAEEKEFETWVKARFNS